MNFQSSRLQIGQWSEQSRFQTVPAKYVRLPATPEFERNRTYIVTTYLVDLVLIFMLLFGLTFGERFSGRAVHDVA